MKKEQPVRPELMIGLVGPAGAPMDEVSSEMRRNFERYRYSVIEIRVSEILDRIKVPDREINLDAESSSLERKMAYGTWLRSKCQRSDVLVGLAIGAIRVKRGNLNASVVEQSSSTEPVHHEAQHEVTPSDDRNDVTVTEDIEMKRLAEDAKHDPQSAPVADTAYIVRGLKHPSEVTRLRSVYGAHFTLVGVYAPREERLDRIANRLAEEASNPKADGYRSEAERLLSKDEDEGNESYGQDVSDTFPKADYFIDSSASGRYSSQVERFCRLMFGYPFATPTPDEYAMFHAHSASLRSAAMGRQVGAAIVKPDTGDVVSMGMNEVPKAFGGHYWEGDDPDGRDFNFGADLSDKRKKAVASGIIRSFSEKEWLKDDVKESLNAHLRDPLGKNSPLHKTWIANLTEFNRDVHAEMSAIVAAARAGQAVQGTSLYCTVFPCHNCAKHIIAAGIAKVVYIAPYSKSLTRDLHREAVALDGDCAPGRVVFQPFRGVAPSRFEAWFVMRARKEHGNVVRWVEPMCVPWFSLPDLGYPVREANFVDEINAIIKDAAIDLD